MAKFLSGGDILKMKEVRKLTVTEIFDYMVISKQERKVDEMKNSKNALPM
jgi:hypothetical protein